VTVRNDATHGTLAVVRIAPSNRASRDAVVKRCGELLGGFQIRHVVDFEEMATV
jgi:fatty-acyl-CoA synthase